MDDVDLSALSGQHLVELRRLKECLRRFGDRIRDLDRFWIRRSEQRKEMFGIFTVDISIIQCPNLLMHMFFNHIIDKSDVLCTMAFPLRCSLLIDIVTSSALAFSTALAPFPFH